MLETALIINILCQKLQIHSKARAELFSDHKLSDVSMGIGTHKQSLACNYFRIYRSPNWSEL